MNKPKVIIIIILALAFVAVNLAIYNSFYKDKDLNTKHANSKPVDLPEYLGEIEMQSDKKPAWVYVYEDKLYVTYFGEEEVDILNLEGKKTDSFRAKITKDQGAPQGMVKSDRGLVIADYQNEGVGIFADNGRLLDAYYETAEKRQIKPVSVAVYDDVFYITDVNINGWMAVLEDGEMIMEVKGEDEEKKVEFPYGIAVTKDGRVIITDPVGGNVKFFACSGWYAFDIPTSDLGLENPQGLAIDSYGRIHIVDNGSSKVFVFDNMGKFMFTYGKELKNPSTITIDNENRVIYIANTENSSISVWGF